MSSKTQSLLQRSLRTIAVLLACCLLLQAAVPEGWYMAGTKPVDYESGIDAQAVYNGHASAYLKSKKPEIDGFGTLMQNFGADNYMGKRVRFSAFVKAEDVQNWAGLWMRIDGKERAALAFDNMQDRAIKGTADWRKYEVVLDVPQNANGIFFGILLRGTGEVWINGVKFEVVGTDVPTTDKQKPSQPAGPANLDFEK